MQDIALESKINSNQAQGTKDNPGVVENIAHTTKAEAHTAKAEAQAAENIAHTVLPKRKPQRIKSTFSQRT